MQLASRRRLLRGLFLTRVVGSYSLSIVYFLRWLVLAFGNDFLVFRQYGPAGSYFAFQHWLEKQVAGRSRLSVSWQKMKEQSRGALNDSDSLDHEAVVEYNICVAFD